MLAKINRFHGHGSIMFVMRRGQIYRSAGLQLRLLKKSKGVARVAVIVSKKVDKKAVVRNRIRRRIFGIMADKLMELDGQDAIISVFDVRCYDKPDSQLRDELGELLKKARV